MRGFFGRRGRGEKAACRHCRHIFWTSNHSVFAKCIATILAFKSRGRLGRVKSANKGVGIRLKMQHRSYILPEILALAKHLHCRPEEKGGFLPSPNPQLQLAMQGNQYEHGSL